MEVKRIKNQLLIREIFNCDLFDNHIGNIAFEMPDKRKSMVASNGIIKGIIDVEL